MAEKMVSVIKSVTLKTPTFHEVSFAPTYVNFFYGANGAGKSTLATELGQGNGIEWAEDAVPENYEILLYNQDFIDLHFKTLDRLKGVFTLSKDGKDYAAEIETLEQSRKALQKRQIEIGKEKDKVNADLKTAETNFQNACWRNTKELRDNHKPALKGFTKNPQYSQKINTTTPRDCNLDDLEKLYITAFTEGARGYDILTELDGDDHIATIPFCNLLGEEITSSGNTVFASFVKKVQSLDWLAEGHKRFHATAEGLCPYCHQALPDSFEEDFASCFDSAYQDAIEKIQVFRHNYEQHMEIICQILRKPLESELPGDISLDSYTAQYNLLEGKIHNNLAAIDKKLATPAAIVQMEDLGPLLLTLNYELVQFNKRISDNNDIVNKIEDSQEDCKTKLWGLIAYKLEGELETYHQAQTDASEAIRKLNEEDKDITAQLKTKAQEISRLGASSTTTQAAIDGMNALLRDSGFQGFEIVKSSVTKDAYKVVRQDEGHTVAVRLSEGEKHFLSFLYFYNLVKGCDSNGVRKEKIVIIDDPVSSMDQNALFSINALVREMIAICQNNTDYRHQVVSGDYIKQIFILTHNAYFHRSVTANQVQHYPAVNFYLIRKAANVSSIHLCVRNSDTEAGEQENFNPIKNSYAALWSEYRDLTGEIPLMNVIHRILDWYFIELSGFDGLDIRQRILFDERDRFITRNEDGSEDMTLFSLANSMLQFMGAGLADDINYVSDGYTAEQRKKVFQMIFDRMGQSQHYDLMMSKSRDW